MFPVFVSEIEKGFFGFNLQNKKPFVHEASACKCHHTVYNGEKFITEALESILKQDYYPIELIVVDDGSSDNSAEIAQFYQKIRYVRQENSGVPVARNRGIEEAKGTFIVFSDQDDLWKPYKLKMQISCLLDHPETDFVISKRKLLLEAGVKRPSWLKGKLCNPKMLTIPRVRCLQDSLFLRKSECFKPALKIQVMSTGFSGRKISS